MKKTFVCALSAVMIAGMMAGSVSGYAAEKDNSGIETVTISVEELEALTAGGDYLTSPTDGIETGTIDAQLISKAETLVGGFVSPKTPKLTKTRKKIFTKAFKNFVGSDVTPIAYLGKQVVAGTNYLFLGSIKAVVPDAKEYYCFVTINKDLDGKYSILDISNTEIETKVNNLMGGWSKALDVKVSKTVKKAMNKALEDLVGVDYKPVAVLAQQVVAGMNYCVLCESKVVYPGAKTDYSFVYLYKGLDGGAEILDIKKFAKNLKEEIAVPESNDAEHSMKTLIVAVDKEASKEKLEKIFSDHGFSILYAYESINGYAISLAEDVNEKTLVKLMKTLEAYDEIISVEKDYIYHINDQPGQNPQDVSI